MRKRICHSPYDTLRKLNSDFRASFVEFEGFQFFEYYTTFQINSIIIRNFLAKYAASCVEFSETSSRRINVWNTISSCKTFWKVNYLYLFLLQRNFRRKTRAFRISSWKFPTSRFATASALVRGKYKNLLKLTSFRQIGVMHTVPNQVKGKKKLHPNGRKVCI